MFEFAWLWVLAALPLPLLVYWFLPARRQQDTAALRVPSSMHFTASTHNSHSTKRHRLWLASLIWCLLVLAAAKPQWLGEPVAVPSEGRDLMLAVDLSGSMKMEDMQIQDKMVNRLVMIKSVLSDFIERRIGDRLGLILFADTAYLQTPLTFDRDTVAKLLDEAVIGLVGEKTAIGDAVGLAVKRFQQKQKSNRVLILLTDGQNTAGNISPEQANELAIENEVTIYTIGVGADEKIVNSFFGQRRVNPSADLDERMLTQLARSTGGQYFRARDAQDLAQIYLTLDTLEPIQGEGQKMRPLSALHYYPLGLAFGLSLLMTVPRLIRQFINPVSNT